MSSQYFGFDDDETVEVADPSRNTAMRKSMFTKPPSPKKIPITEIQALLTKDITLNDTTSVSTLNESSFYADEDTSICHSHLNFASDESFSVDEPLSRNITPLRKRTRKIPKSETKSRKVLGSLENRNDENEGQLTPVSKKLISRSATKNKENQKPKKSKSAKNNIADENYDHLAEQLKKRFDEIENFQLVVE